MATSAEAKYEQLKADRAAAQQKADGAAIERERQHYLRQVYSITAKMEATWLRIEAEQR
jgi:hypothetical protein